MFIPTNEQGTIAVFMANAETAGWSLIEIGSQFPDAILRHRNEEWRVEFEFVASNFIAHGHDYRCCDLIICWNNDLDDCPLPVLAISDPDWITREMVKGNPHKIEAEYWRVRALRAERELKRLLKTPTDSDEPIQPTSEEIDSSIQFKMLAIYQREPNISDERMANEIGISKRRVQLLREDLAFKKVIHVEPMGKGKSVTVNGQLPAFMAGELN